MNNNDSFDSSRRLIFRLIRNLVLCSSMNNMFVHIYLSFICANIIAILIILVRVLFGSGTKGTFQRREKKSRMIHISRNLVELNFSVEKLVLRNHLLNSISKEGGFRVDFY